jgi:hypothetical protein
MSRQAAGRLRSEALSPAFDEIRPQRHPRHEEQKQSCEARRAME